MRTIRKRNIRVVGRTEYAMRRAAVAAEEWQAHPCPATRREFDERMRRYIWRDHYARARRRVGP